MNCCHKPITFFPGSCISCHSCISLHEEKCADPASWELKGMECTIGMVEDTYTNLRRALVGNFHMPLRSQEFQCFKINIISKYFLKAKQKFCTQKNFSWLLINQSKNNWNVKYVHILRYKPQPLIFINKTLVNPKNIFLDKKVWQSFTNLRKGKKRLSNRKC